MRKKKTSNQIELLAPAGSYETFLAVLSAGADAVYLGGSQFGARAYAANFKEEELLRAIDDAHLHGRQVYLTVNTLLKEEEYRTQLYDYLLPYYRQGLDAVIVQDMGALSMIRREFPDLAVHTSTQMTVTGWYGAAYMKSLGASRIVTAREMSLSEIRSIRDHVDIEIESFVHGALCYCYSGQCLFSSMLGGRSGNRGRCAQPCRLPYEAYDSNFVKLRQKGAYILSPKDLCTITEIPDLYESGVDSFKIEGRMKQAEYAAGVVSVYRACIDRYLEDVEKYGVTEAGERYQVTKEDQQKLWDFGNRSGFTDGYYHRPGGKEMITFEKPNHAKSNEILQEEIRRTYIQKELKEKIKGILKLKKDFPATIELSCEDTHITISGQVVQTALKQPLSCEKVESSMKKTGNTPFEFAELEIEMEEDIFLPVQALNQLRRDALLQLEERLTAVYRREENTDNFKWNGQTAEINNNWQSNACLVPENKQSKSVLMPYNQSEAGMMQDTDRRMSSAESSGIHLAVSVENRKLLRAVLEYPFVEDIYLDSSCYTREHLWQQLGEDIDRIHQSDKRAYYILPAVFRDKTAEFYKSGREKLLQHNPDGLVLKSYDAVWFAQDLQINCILDHNLYTYNQGAKELLDRLRPLRDTAPVELNRRELMERDNRNSELLLYGYLPLMTSAQCVHANTGVCDRKPQITYLKDRYGKYFPVKNNCAECYNTIYNSTPLLLFGIKDDLQKMDMQFVRIAFTVEEEKRVHNILRLYQETFVTSGKGVKEIFHEEYTNGHYKRGVE